MPSAGRTNAGIIDENTFTFGRYDFTRDGLAEEAEEAGKSDDFIAFLRSVKLSDLLDTARAEAAMNPIDDEAGWDETSLLLAAASSIAHIGMDNLRTILDRGK